MPTSNLIDAALSPSEAPPQQNLINSALSQPTHPAPVSPASSDNLIDSALGQTSAKPVNLIDSALAKPARMPAPLIPPEARIEPAQLSVWDRVKNIFTSSIPQFSSRTSSNPKYGQMQLASPEEAMSPAEQYRHPVLTATGEFAGGLTSPESVALIAGTGGLGEIGGAAGKIVPRLVSGGFALQQVYSAAKTYPEIRDAIKAGDYNRAEFLLTKAGLQTGLAALSAKHAVTGKGAVRGKADVDTDSLSEVHPIPADEPTAQILEEHAPGVRLVDSTATKEHLVALQTVAEPKPEPTLFHGTNNAETIRTNGFRLGNDENSSYLGDNYAEGVYLSKTRAPYEEGGQLEDAADVLPVTTSAKNIKHVDGFDGLQKLYGEHNISATDPDAAGKITQVLKKDGFDGLDIGDEVVIFEPSKVALRIPATARVVSDEALPVVSRSEIVNEAIQRVVNNSDELKRLGLDPEKIQSREDVPAMLNSVADKIKGHMDPRVGATITFDAQKALANDLNINVEDLLARKSGAAANAETAIAARALLKDSQTRVMNLARLAAMGDSDYQAKFAEALAQHQAVTDSVRGMAAEAGRALGSFRISEADLPDEKISDAFANLPKDSLQEAAKLLSKIDPNDTHQINSFIEQIKPASTGDKVFEYYRNALLSSPKTVIVKTASEVAMLGLEAMKKFVVSGLSEDRFAAESWAYAQGAVDAMKHAPDILAGRFNLDDAPGFEGGGRQAIKGMLGTFVRVPGKVLERGANLMYALNYFGELRAQATRAAIKEGLSGQDLYARTEHLVANPTEAMTDAAHEIALHGTFQTQLGKFGKNVQRAISSDPTGVSRFLFPFFRTPIDLVKASGEFSPYGLLKGIVKSDADLTARGIIGSSIAAGVAALALEGHITGGGPIDFRKQQTLKATGWQPYSLKVGGRYISYHRFEPLGLVMGLIADTVHGIKLGDSNEITSSKADTALAHIERNVSDLPFLYGLSSIVDALKDASGKRIDNFISRQIASFIPAGVANIAEGSDRTLRHPQGIAETVESRIPGLTSNVPPSLDIAGKPLQRPVSALGGANPFPVTTTKDDSVLSELARLGIATPQMPKAVKQGTKQFDLTESEAQQLAQQEGQHLYRNLGRAMSTPMWAKATDEQKATAIKGWRTEFARTRVGRLMRLRNPQNP
jgi:hypothetical protein